MGCEHSTVNKEKDNSNHTKSPNNNNNDNNDNNNNNLKSILINNTDRRTLQICEHDERKVWKLDFKNNSLTRYDRNRYYNSQFTITNEVEDEIKIEGNFGNTLPFYIRFNRKEMVYSNLEKFKCLAHLYIKNDDTFFYHLNAIYVVILEECRA